MDYDQGYAQAQYGGYQGYGNAQQTPLYQTQYQQTQHPMVVIPSQQPKSDVSRFQASPLPYQSFSQPEFYQSQTQYYTPPQQQDYYSQPQQFLSQGNVRQPSFQYQNHLQSQDPFQNSHSQLVYHQPVRQQTTQASPQTKYYQPPSQPVQASPPLPVQRPPQQIHQTTQYYTPPQQATAPRTKQRNGQQAHGPRSTPQSHPPSSPDPLSYRPLSQQRVVARVEIPVQRPGPAPVKAEMPRSPKRRRSNDGNAIPVCNVPLPVKQHVAQKPKQAPVSSSPLTELASSQLPPPPTPKPSVDYQAVLLNMSDEYVSVAHSLSTSIATGTASEEQQEEYHSLLSTAMGCLESVLRNYRQSDPRREERIRLRLASLLVEETENDQEAEEVLSKGIALCERSRLTDLKYTMHHLSARLYFKRSPKAALKAVDKLIQEAETLHQLHWVYGFRFLRVSLSMQLGGHAEHATTLKHLGAINTLAENQRHISVQIVAATLEAIVHLRAGTNDVVDLTQRAMATARTYQLGDEMQQMPQMRALLDSLDLMCSLIQFHPDRAEAKMKQMQNNLDQGTRGGGWHKDGSFTIQIGENANDNLQGDTGDLMRRNEDGEAELTFSWITSSQLYVLGFVLSGITKLFQNSSDGKAEQFLREGLKLATFRQEQITQSLTVASARTEQQESLIIASRLYLIFACCGRHDWNDALASINTLKKELRNTGSIPDDATRRMLIYLEALCRQGLGEMRAAFKLYQSAALLFQSESKAGVMEKDLRALATLNSVFVLRSSSAENLAKSDELLAAVEPYCQSHKSKSFFSLYQLARATAPGAHNTIIKTKQYIQTSVQAAKEASNNQLLCIVMNLMTDTFFKNTIVGEQAEKAASAGRSLAKRSKNKLWTAVADEMYADIMERCGKHNEADAAKREAQNLVMEMPEALRNGF